MIINWFPGHMTKALKMMEEEVKKVDAIIYVLDSRAPFSCVNPKFTKLIGEKPIVYVFNKFDLADSKVIDGWFPYFKGQNTKCVKINSTESNSGKKIISALTVLLEQKIKRNQKKGIKLILRAIVIGVPNCGKSTLINNLCGKYKAQTGNIPGVTKSKQWVKLGGNFEVLDTPGTLWPAFTNNIIAKNLAYIGSIKEEVLDIFELALEFISDINNIDEQILKNRYNIEFDKNLEKPLQILEKICEKRNLKLKGNEFDYLRGSKMLITEFKQGKIGKITIEKIENLKELTKKIKL